MASEGDLNMKNLGWTEVSLQDRMAEGACWLTDETGEPSPCPEDAGPRPRASRWNDPEPQKPSLNEEAVRSAFYRYRAGEDGAGPELLSILFKIRKGWANSIRWYKGASWDLAHDAVLDTVLYIHEKARAKKKSKFYLPLTGLRRFIFRLVCQKLWDLKRRAHQVNIKRRDKKAKRGEAANLFLPRIIHVREAPEAKPGVIVEKRDLDRIALRAFFKLPRRKRAMALAHFEGIPYEEIARMTGTTERAARVHVSTLLARLRTSLGIEKTKAPLNKETVGRA
jgi:DNA-directed RNA polymerase specialized sigma24 family protein